MPVGSDFRVSLPAMGTSHANYALGLEADGLGPHPRMFKRHKVLPHPRRDDAPRTSPLRYSLGSEAALSHNGGSPRAVPSGRSRASRMGRGPEPPPTPPAHSRTSSASHPADPSTPNHAGTPSGSTDNVQAPPPATPPIQQTPPTPNLTPDRTPPGPAASLAHRRPPITDRNSSKLTTDSRAESFRTAPENPYSSDDDGGRATLRPALPSAKTSQSTVRQVNGEARSVSQPVGLGLGLESSPGGDATPKTVGDFNKFDGEWAAGAAGADAADKWDDSLMRNVTVRKRRPTRAAENVTKEIVDNRTVTPTNATKALRSMSLQDSPVLYPPRRVVSDRLPARTAPLNSESSSSIEIKRSSVMSTKSNASTVVEAMLVETAPQRRKTLRHVRKQSALRDSSSEISPPSSAPTSVSPAADDRRRRLESTTSRAGEAVRESYASTATCNSISSRKARRSVWKSGGVPVIVIPDRRSSVKSNSKSPSLRSTSSRRSQSNTPFSVISVETTATSNAEVSEAMAVNIYPHQSKSVVLVDHSAKPSESSTLESYKASGSNIPIVKTTDANGGVPATPPQQFSVDDVDSPLRNPRAPPKPPAINFIPATPSGLTPSTEKQKQLGNYYEITAEKPKRSTSLLKRALTGRTTDYGPSPVRPVGFLTRTFSLSRNIRRRPGDWEDERPGLRRRSTADSVPQDETRLHPFWRPAYADDESCSEDDEYNDREDRDRDHFDHFPATADDAPDRRTIRRTPSGNLRVMKFRRSMESLTRVPTGAANTRSYTSPEGPQQQEGGGGDSRGRRLWRSLSSRARSSLRRGSSQPARPRGPRPQPPPAARAPREPAFPPVSGSAAAGGGFLPTLGDRINLPRRLSERRREKRTQELRGMISAPREVRDGVGDVIRRDPAAWRDRDAMYVREQQAERQRVLQREQQQQQQQQQQMLQHGQQRQRQPHHRPQRWEEEGWDGGV
ncbi:hypothetical protein NEMBOFW57_004954 [Staphylotrichum longicolle]|uniref:Uncharacterized protein n=1 Tax=Staphylotrichum longicolle TaxID=669026 RepID=A0AAD4HZS1_9PEZI|nr:hypothetical protein NEMBOFW57_004954 [Staphylotrichum longicolle]